MCPVHNTRKEGGLLLWTKFLYRQWFYSVMLQFSVHHQTGTRLPRRARRCRRGQLYISYSEIRYNSVHAQWIVKAPRRTLSFGKRYVVCHLWLDRYHPLPDFSLSASFSMNILATFNMETTKPQYSQQCVYREVRQPPQWIVKYIHFLPYMYKTCRQSYKSLAQFRDGKINREQLALQASACIDILILRPNFSRPEGKHPTAVSIDTDGGKPLRIEELNIALNTGKSTAFNAFTTHVLAHLQRDVWRSSTNKQYNTISFERIKFNW